MRLRVLLAPVCLALSFAPTAACVTPEDFPSSVKDLRVLGVQLEPPELMASPCQLQEEALFASLAQLALTQVTYTALLADPAGAGRSIEYELNACPSPVDRTCEDPGDRVLLAQGTTTAGELQFGLTPSAALTPLPSRDGDTLLKSVLDEDPYKGLGGLRIPLVLRVRAGDEEIYAQKLLVLTCRLPTLEQMQPNVTPVLPGVLIDGIPWGPNDVPLLTTGRTYALEPFDFGGVQESYVVPSFELEPVQLEERWKVAWYTTLGRISPNETGGADLGSQSARHRVNWSVTGTPPETDVTFWFVVRDGRGGQSWLTRTAHFRP